MWRAGNGLWLYLRSVNPRDLALQLRHQFVGGQLHVSVVRYNNGLAYAINVLNPMGFLENLQPAKELFSIENWPVQVLLSALVD